MVLAVTIVLLVLFVLIVTWKVITGLKANGAQAVAILVCDLLTAFISIMFTPVILNAIGETFMFKLASAFHEDLASNAVLAGITADVITAFACVIVYIIFYVIIYIILKAVVKACFKKESSNPKLLGGPSGKIIAMLVSGLNCAVLLYFMFIPLYGMFISAAEDIVVLSQAKTENANINESLDKVKGLTGLDGDEEELSAYSSFRNVFTCGIYDRLTTFDYAAGSTRIHDEMIAAGNIFNRIAPTIPNEKFETTRENVEILRAAKNEIFTSDFFKTVLIEMTRDACSAWYYGYSYLDIADPFKDTAYRKSSRTIYESLMEADERQIDAAFDLAISMIRVKAVKNDLDTIAAANDNASGPQIILDSLNDEDTVSTLISNVKPENVGMVMELISDSTADEAPETAESGEGKASFGSLGEAADAMEGVVSQNTVMKVLNSLVMSMAYVEPENLEEEVSLVMSAIDIISTVMGSEDDKVCDAVAEKYRELIDLSLNSQILRDTIDKLAADGTFELFRLSEGEKLNAADVLNEYMSKASPEEKEETGKLLKNYAELFGLEGVNF